MIAYFDNNATTPIHLEVKQIIREELEISPSNPSSLHKLGYKARIRLDNYRKKCAELLGISETNFLFTSSATEGANFLIHNFIFSHPKTHIIASSVEHACVYHYLKTLESIGYQISWIYPEEGAFNLSTIEKAIRPETKLMCFMLANNETGHIYDIESIASIASRHQIPLIVDGVAALGKMCLPNINQLAGITFSGHKIHGPTGVGAVFLKKSYRRHSLLKGGAQEFGMRAGTECLPMIAGFTKALELAFQEKEKRIHMMKTLLDTFEKKLCKTIKSIQIHRSKNRLCNTSNVCFYNVAAETLLIFLDQNHIAASYGSACSSGALEPSRVLMNMGVSYESAKSSIRFSFSHFNTLEEIDYVIKKLSEFYAFLPKNNKQI